MWLSAPTAFAGPETCPPTTVEARLPLDGDVGVPPEVRPILVATAESCGTATTPLLLDAGGGEVLTAVETPYPKVQRVIPAAPLEAGAWSLLASDADGSLQTTFTVGDGAPPTPSVPSLDAVFDRTCGGLMLIEAEATLAFADADPAQRGLLVPVARVDDGAEQVAGIPRVYAGERTATLEVAAAGRVGLCVSVRLEDLVGDVVWQSDELCGTVDPCRTRDAGDPCGCSSLGASGHLWPLLALIAGRRARA